MVALLTMVAGMKAPLLRTLPPQLSLVPPVPPQQLLSPLPYFDRRFIKSEFLLGARAMVEVQHLLVLGSAAMRGVCFVLALLFPTTLATTQTWTRW